MTVLETVAYYLVFSDLKSSTAQLAAQFCSSTRSTRAARPEAIRWPTISAGVIRYTDAITSYLTPLFS